MRHARQKPTGRLDPSPSYRRVPPEIPTSTWLWVAFFVLLATAFLALILVRFGSNAEGRRQINVAELVQKILRKGTSETTEPISAPPGSEVARVTGRLNSEAPVYSGPGVNYPRLALLESGANVEISGTTEDGTWLRLSLPYLQPGEGWVMSGAVELPMDAHLPVVEQTSIPPPPTPTMPVFELTAFVNVNIRSGPGLNYEKIATLKQGEKIQALGIDPEGYWWAVKVPESGEIGWVSVDYVVGVDKDEVPVISPQDVSGALIIPTPAAGKPKLMAKFTVNIRSGPGVEFEVVAQLLAGQEAEIIGVSRDGLWWAIKLQGGGREFGWVSILYVEVQNAENVPVIQG